MVFLVLFIFDLILVFNSKSVFIYQYFAKNNFSYEIILLIMNLSIDPIPGGCNEEFPLEISPFLRLYANQYVNRLEYQFANIGSYDKCFAKNNLYFISSLFLIQTFLSKGAPKGFKPLKCDKSQYLIKYDIYAYFLKENDFSETEYFRAITLMSNESDIKQSAIRVFLL
jgi:hypothetical protein